MDISMYRNGEELFLKANCEVYKVLGRTTQEFRLEQAVEVPNDAKRMADHYTWAIASKLPDELISQA